MMFLYVVTVLLAVKAGAPTLNTIKFPPGSTSHSSHCCLQGLERTSKATVWFCILVRALQPLEIPPWWKAQPRSFPQPSLMIFQRHTQGLVAQCIIVGESSEKHGASFCVFWYEHSLPLSLCLSPLFMMHMYLPWARGGWCESGGREPEQKITALCASVTVWLAAPHKILFTAHTEEKLQQQSSPEAGKSADLATLRERPGEREGVRHYNYYIASPYSQSVSILLR